MKKISNKYKRIIGLACYLGSGLISVITILLNKKYSQKLKLDSTLLLCMRNIILFVIFFPMMIAQKFQFLRRKNIFKFNFLRDLISLTAVLLWYKCTSLVPINNATAMSFLTPIFVLIAWSKISKKKISANLYWGMSLNFIGLLIITGFEKDGVLFAYLGIVCVAILRAIVNILSKLMVDVQPIKSTLLTSIFFQFFMSCIVAIFMTDKITNHLQKNALIVIFAISILYFFYILLFFISVSLVNLDVLQPFDFMRIIFSIILSFAFLSESPSYHEIIGMIAISVGIVWSNLMQKSAKNPIVENIN